MKYIVYRTTNLVNGKVYVGVHRTNPDIFDGYIGCGVTNKDKKKTVLKGFPAAVRKYGYKNFKRETLFEFPDTEEGRKAAYKKEEDIVDEDFIKSSKTYNLCRGGKMPLHYSLSKNIAQYDLDGTFIRAWSSIKEASENLGISANSISQCCIGNYHTGGDYQWRYYTDDNNICKAHIKEKSVYQFDLSGNLIHSWRSAVEAAEQFVNKKSARVAINNNCNGKVRKAYGYYWSFKRRFEYCPYDRKTAVAAYGKDGKFIRSYDSAEEAAKSTGADSGNIISCIRGKHKTIKGYRWRYFYGNTSDIR